MRKKALLPIMVALAAIVLLGCKNPVTSSTDTVINLAAIAGVTAPATGASPVTAITETAQYTGTVAWNDSPATFAASTVYTATITLTAKAGYTLTGVAENFFTVTGATATNPENSGVITAVFPTTETITINLAAIAGVTAPATGASPVTAITETAQYTGTVAWNDSPATFAASTVYTATITLTAKAGYTLTGVAENFFTVTGATATNPENSGVITAVFSKTTFFLAKNYINTTPGFGIRYHITDNNERYAFDSYAWAVSQNLTTNLPKELDFVITLNDEKKSNLSNSLGGKYNLIFNEEKYLGLYSGNPSRNQGNFYLNLMLPVYFDMDMSWTVNTTTFFIADLEDITIGANTFTNCQRVNITDTDSSEYLNGSGYVLYAKDIGIKIYFKRTDGSEVIFTYDSHFQFIENTITGTVFSSGDIPANGKIIQISYENWGNRSITNSDGQYSISAFGPDIVLRIGDDIDNNNILDFTPDRPKEFWLNNITSSINNINIILSDL